MKVMENETIGNVVLDYSSYPGEDFYSEGAGEDELLEIVKNHTEEEYNHMIQEKRKWSVLYHLSHIRGNIVDFLPIRKTDSVLEVGAGCGAITGTLAKKAGKVTCIELSRRRSLINAYRNQKYENVEIKVGNFQDIEKKLTQTYDYIMLIGVFEYAASYISGESPYEKFLEILSRHMKKGGRIVIAIENKTGMKYLAGCREDHAGLFYEGMMGYAHTSGVRTFSKDELTRITKKCGFENEFFYPYPDYKLPITIYSNEFLPRNGELNENMRNFDADRFIAFDESLAFNEALRVGRFPEYSNSFLCLLTKSADGDTVLRRRPIYSKHSNERSDEYCIRTDIEIDRDGKRYAVKYPLTQAAEKHVAAMFDFYKWQKQEYEGTKLKPNHCRPLEDRPNAVEFEYLTGNTLETELNLLFGQGMDEAAIAVIREFMDIIRNLPGMAVFEKTERFQEFFGDADLPEGQKSLKVTNLDLIFSNIIINNGWNVIDYEWTFDFPIPLHFLIYRALFYYFRGEREPLMEKYHFYEMFNITEEERAAFQQMEIKFQQRIIRGKVSLIGMYALMGCNALEIDRLMKLAALLPKADRVKVYFDRGQGFFETDCCYYQAQLTEEDRVVFDLEVGADVQGLRIDPADYACMVRIHEMPVEEVLVNGVVLPENLVIYNTDDPQILLNAPEMSGRKIHVEYTISRLRDDFYQTIVAFIEQNKNTERHLFRKKRQEPYEKVRISLVEK